MLDKNKWNEKMCNFIKTSILDGFKKKFKGFSFEPEEFKGFQMKNSIINEYLKKSDKPILRDYILKSLDKIFTEANFFRSLFG